MTEAPTVFVVDDDPSVRRSTERLVRSMGFAVRTFASAKEFLDNARVEGPACLVLDVRMPGLSGLDLQHELTQSGTQISIVSIERERAWHRAQLEAGALRERYGRLTPREREVMAHVVAGLPNRQIAGQLATTERTVKFHRAHIMEEMEAASRPSSRSRTWW